jgi:hypothetical protein
MVNIAKITQTWTTLKSTQVQNYLTDFEIQDQIDKGVVPFLINAFHFKYSPQNLFQMADKYLGTTLNKKEVMTDQFWANPIQNICFYVGGVNCNYDLGIYGTDAPFELFQYVL